MTNHTSYTWLQGALAAPAPSRTSHGRRPKWRSRFSRRSAHGCLARVLHVRPVRLHTAEARLVATRVAPDDPRSPFSPPPFEAAASVRARAHRRRRRARRPAAARPGAGRRLRECHDAARGRRAGDRASRVGPRGSGFVAIAPELPNVRGGEVTPETIDALVRVARAEGRRLRSSARRPEQGSRSSQQAIPDRAPCDRSRCDRTLREPPESSPPRDDRLLRDRRSRQHRWSALRRPLARASAPDDPGVPALLANRDPGRFDALYDALEPATRALVESSRR